MKNILLIIAFAASAAMAQNNESKMNTYKLPPLKYNADALAPVISEQTISYHYGKHLQTYINNLNNLIVGTEFENMPLEDIIRKSDGALFNNAAQTFNHIFYFDTFSPTPKAEPTGKLLKAIEQEWGSVADFKKAFDAAGVGIFGSGWVWLVSDANGKLSIVKSANAGNPLTQGLKPLLTADVWEHAYYLDFQNRRADQLANLWKIVDWEVVENRY